MKKVLVIDGQGGRIGAALIAKLADNPDLEITCVGANSAATAAMMKAGAARGATGENPVRVLSREADIIAGPVGIVLADSMLGEITEKMASAVSSSKAIRVLIPVARCRTLVAGCRDASLSSLIDDAAAKIADSGDDA